jgi:hypothetical protein
MDQPVEHPLSWFPSAMDWLAVHISFPNGPANGTLTVLISISNGLAGCSYFMVNYWVIWVDAYKCPATGYSMSDANGLVGTLISVIYRLWNKMSWEFHLVQCIIQYFGTRKWSDYYCRYLWVSYHWWLHVWQRQSSQNIDCSDI